MPEEVEAMLLEDAKKDDQKRKDKERRSHTNQLTITSMLGPAAAAQTNPPITPQQTNKSQIGTNNVASKSVKQLKGNETHLSPLPQTTNEKPAALTVGSIKNAKKRGRDEQQLQQAQLSNTQMTKGEEQFEIDQILVVLKERVLTNETLNKFKKEMTQIADLIDKRDPQWNSTFSQGNSQKLAAILQKPNHYEILYMLQRNCLFEKRKKKRNEYERHVQLCKSKIEQDLKTLNKKSDVDFVVELENLAVKDAKVQLQEEFLGLLPTLNKYLGEHVQINNEYVNIKTLEEKVKAKKMRPGPAEQKAQENLLDFSSELDKALDQIVSSLSEQFRPHLKGRILEALGLRKPEPIPIEEEKAVPAVEDERSSTTSPVRGNVWNVIKVFAEIKRPPPVNV